MTEKKEIGKLIELLNEYMPAEKNCSYELYDKWVDIKKQTPQILYVENTYAEGIVIENQTLYFISKKGGFIKWLVENEKIDTDIVYKKGFLAKTYDKDEVGEYFEPYEEILMLLSIQDEPIEFLVSILK